MKLFLFLTRARRQKKQNKLARALHRKKKVSQKNVSVNNQEQQANRTFH